MLWQVEIRNTSTSSLEVEDTAKGLLEVVTKADVKFTLTVSAPHEVLSDARKILLLTRIQGKYSVQAECFLSWFLPRKQASLHIKYLGRCTLKVETFIERVPGFELTCAAGFGSWELCLVKPTQSLKKVHLWRAVTFFVCHFRVSSLPILFTKGEVGAFVISLITSGNSVQVSSWKPCALKVNLLIDLTHKSEWGKSKPCIPTYYLGC